MALPGVQCDQIWEIDFGPQTHKEEPGKRRRPALVIRVNIFNGAGHATTVIPGGSQVYCDTRRDDYPLRMSLGKLSKAKMETDLLIDQIRTISNQRLMGDKPNVELSQVQMKRCGFWWGFRC